MLTRQSLAQLWSERKPDREYRGRPHCWKRDLWRKLRHVAPNVPAATRVNDHVHGRGYISGERLPCSSPLERRLFGWDGLHDHRIRGICPACDHGGSARIRERKRFDLEERPCL